MGWGESDGEEGCCVSMGTGWVSLRESDVRVAVWRVLYLLDTGWCICKGLLFCFSLAKRKVAAVSFRSGYPRGVRHVTVS